MDYQSIWLYVFIAAVGVWIIWSVYKLVSIGDDVSSIMRFLSQQAQEAQKAERQPEKPRRKRNPKPGEQGCGFCEGKGVVKVVSQGRSRFIDCPECGGTGFKEGEQHGEA